MLAEFLRVQWNWKMYWHFKEQDMKDNVLRSHDVKTCECPICAEIRTSVNSDSNMAGDVAATSAPMSKEDLEGRR
jgi:hypothetical protein